LRHIAKRKRKKLPRQDYSDPLNPFGDPFKIQREPRGGVSKKRRPPSAAPEARALYDLQTDILKALSALEKEEYDGKALRPIKNAYRIINRYLRQYVNAFEDPNSIDPTEDFRNNGLL
jgi:hypothetical protein